MQAVKLCSNKILQFLTVVLENFSAILPAMQRVVCGYLGGGGQDAVVSGILSCVMAIKR